MEDAAEKALIYYACNSHRLL